MFSSSLNLVHLVSSVQYQRFTSDVKKKIIDAIEVAKLSIPISECLDVIGLSKQKFANWCS